MKRLLKVPMILLGITVLAILFNNCSQVGFVSGLAPANLSAFRADNNGSGYGGKLTQDYYHYVPGYMCENRSSPFSRIEYSPSEVNSIFSSSKENQCLSLPQTIPNSEIDAGTLQQKAIGYGEKIFEVNSAGPLVVPESPIEIWCVDQWSDPTIEVLSIYNKSQNRAETDFYYPGVPKRSELNPARSVNQQTVRLTSNYFDLIVEKSQIGLKAGTFQGRLTINGNPGPEKNLQCRLGGYLDARIWPAKAVNYDVLEQMAWAPLEGLFYTITGHSGFAPWAENILSTYSADGTQRTVLIGNTLNAAGVRNFNFSEDRKNLFVQGMLTGDITTQLYSLNPKIASKPRRLNNQLTDWGQFVSGDIISNPNSDLVYYLDGAQETGADIEQWLRAVSLSTGTITQISKSLFGADEMVGQYDVSYPLSKVVYSVGFVEHEIWITDMLGTRPRKIDLSPYLGQGYFLEWYIKKASRWVLVNDRHLVLVAASRNYLNMTSLLLTIDLASETVIFNQVIKGVRFLRPVNGLPFVTVLSSLESVEYLDLSSNTLKTVEQVISSQKTSTSVTAQQFAANLMVVTAKDLCANDEKLISRVPIDNERWLLIKKGNGAKSSLYILSTQSSACTLINHLVFPVGFLEAVSQQYLLNPMIKYSNLFGNQFLKTKISSDQRNLLVAIMGRLYLVPVDGHPVVEIYTPHNLKPNFYEIGFVSNSKIYFEGSVIRDNVRQLFLWDVPQY